ncbi:MAG: shikimate dehydrogenase [Actinomycetota bacterium]
MTPTSRTRIAAVIGSPVRHSLSPVIHNAAFAAHGDDWVYGAFEVQPEHAAAAIDAMRILGIAGLSVTMPHKEMVMAALDEVSPVAALVRAVNTVARRDDGRLVGHNVDGVGCVDALTRAGADLSSVAVIGAGATARAVVAALVAHGANVHVANRTPARRDDAVRIGNAARTGSTSGVELAAVGECATIINTTPQGMRDVSPDTLPLDAAMLHGNQTVLDAVYHPLETGLLQAARARGCRVVDGLEMLCAQAARQQELWLGRLPDVGLMRVAALDELAKSQR